jgi:hypothetical protein
MENQDTQKTAAGTSAAEKITKTYQHGHWLVELYDQGTIIAQHQHTCEVIPGRQHAGGVELDGDFSQFRVEGQTVEEAINAYLDYAGSGAKERKSDDEDEELENIPFRLRGQYGGW